MDKAVCYLRVSTQEQVVEGVSLAAQRERLQAYCASRGLEVVEFITDEGVSGSKPLETRDGGKRLIDLLRRKSTKHIVAVKLDRLFRNTSDALKHTSAWDRRGVSLHLLDMAGQAVDTSSAIGKMFLTLVAAFGEFEKNLISERTATALRFKRSQNQVFNHPPFGYDRVGDQLVANKKEGAVVEKVLTWRRGGETMAAIAVRLNSDRVPTKRRGKWYASTVRQILVANKSVN